MKKITYILCVVSAILLTTSCEKDLPVFNDEEANLVFYYDGLDFTKNFEYNMSLSNFSFVYSSPDVMQDTVWVEVETMGLLRDYDRPVKFVQKDTADVVQAVPGKHYVSFDDPSLAKYYVVPAGKSRARIPIVLLRDASLNDADVVLKFGIGANDSFLPGYDVLTTRTLTISNSLSKPANWDDFDYSTYLSMLWYYGEYGKEKHRFLIEHTGFKWDEAFIAELIGGDEGYFSYLYQKLVNELAAYNETRLAQGLDVLKEADGTVVELYYYY